MKIIGIRTKAGIYASVLNVNDIQGSRDYGEVSYENLSRYIVNGTVPRPSFHRDWSLIETEPLTVQKTKKQPDINHRYVIKDTAMIGDRTPAFFAREDVADNENGEWEWKEEYAMLRSLYNEVSDSQPDTVVNVEFEYEEIITCDKLMEPVKSGLFAQSSVINQLIDRISFPEIMLPSCRCKLSVAESYRVIRAYVKNNIDGRYAEITSDYDCCLTVKKKICLPEPEEYTVDVNQFSIKKKKPKYVIQYRRHRMVDCYRVAPSAYNNYPVLKNGFSGDNQQDLENNINQYCKDLMEFINRPLVECPHCKGAGVLMDEFNSEIND